MNDQIELTLYIVRVEEEEEKNVDGKTFLIVVTQDIP